MPMMHSLIPGFQHKSTVAPARFTSGASCFAFAFTSAHTSPDYGGLLPQTTVLLDVACLILISVISFKMSAIDPGHEEGIKQAGDDIESEQSASELEEENEVRVSCDDYSKVVFAFSVSE